MTGVPGSSVAYEPIALSAESAVVSEFVPDPTVQTAYQSEGDLEKAFVALLQEQAYEYLPLRSEAGLVANLRTQLEALNSIAFTDEEWRRFFGEKRLFANEGVVAGW